MLASRECFINLRRGLFRNSSKKREKGKRDADPHDSCRCDIDAGTKSLGRLCWKLYG